MTHTSGSGFPGERRKHCSVPYHMASEYVCSQAIYTKIYSAGFSEGSGGKIPNDTEGDASVSHKIVSVIQVEVQTRNHLQDNTKRQHAFVQHFLTLAELKVAL